jgi:hypothetical protein
MSETLIAVRWLKDCLFGKKDEHAIMLRSVALRLVVRGYCTLCEH